MSHAPRSSLYAVSFSTTSIISGLLSALGIYTTIHYESGPVYSSAPIALSVIELINAILNVLQMYISDFPLLMLPIARILYTSMMMTFTVDVLIRLRNSISYDPKGRERRIRIALALEFSCGTLLGVALSYLPSGLRGVVPFLALLTNNVLGLLIVAIYAVIAVSVRKARVQPTEDVELDTIERPVSHVRRVQVQPAVDTDLASEQASSVTDVNSINAVLPSSSDNVPNLAVQPVHCSLLNAADIVIITFIVFSMAPQLVLFVNVLRANYQILVIRACRFCFVIGYICDSVVHIFRREETVRGVRRMVRVWRQQRQLKRELQYRARVH